MQTEGDKRARLIPLRTVGPATASAGRFSDALLLLRDTSRRTLNNRRVESKISKNCTVRNEVGLAVVDRRLAACAFL
eukprot:scaffold72490_cov26-Tisochrysis_lutea.AAC.3